MQKNIISFLLFLTAFSSLALQSQAEMQPILKSRAGVPPPDILKEILTTGKQSLDKNATPQPSSSDAPYITWVADADARVQPEFILAQPVRRIFSVRNLANQLNTSIGAVDYGVLSLHSPILLITGNTDSESLRLFSAGYGGLAPTIGRELDHLYPALGARAENTQEDDRTRELRQVEKNVNFQVEQAMERYRERISNSRLVVVGSVLDIANHYGRGANQLFIININGETDGKKIKKSALLRMLDPKLLDNIGRPPALEQK
ncbi:MAG: carbonic anhydrase [Deltaproteobacteria bacterium]|nr:carbonic anhydrase [Deltaproteobacteria bacterium]